MAKELYKGPSMVHGQTLRGTLNHIKGHGHAAKLAFGVKHRGMGRGTSKARLRKKAEHAFL